MTVASNTSTALYMIADTLQIPIILDKYGGHAHGNKKARVGPVSMEFPLDLRTDFIKGGRVGAAFKVRGDLWGYIFVDNDVVKDIYCWYVLFKGGATGQFTDYMKGDVRETMKVIGDKVVAIYKLAKGSIWVDLSHKKWDELPM